MPRYVDADVLKETIENAEYFDISQIDEAPTADVVSKELYDRLLKNSIIIYEALNEYQTIDVIGVVQCKDCEHYKQSEADPNRKMCWRKDVDGFHVCYDFRPTDYCSYGERRK